MHRNIVLYLVISSVSGWYLSPSVSRPSQHPRPPLYDGYPRRKIVQQKFLPQIRLEKSLRPTAPCYRSGKKRGIYLTPPQEMVVFESSRRLARPRSYAQDLIDIADEEYHACVRIEIENLKAFLNGSREQELKPVRSQLNLATCLARNVGT